jgi:DNA repair exonuclease SbcCD nuclease subunit
LKSNSLQHNQDCLDFISWFIDTAKKEGCETAFFLGDWNHHRASINMQTMQFGLRSLELLNDNFSRVFFIPGNHDLYYRDRRDIHSVEWARHLSNVTICNDWLIEGDCVISPWLVGDEYKKLSKLNSKYLFGHMEMPNFYMNAMVQMPDHGQLNDGCVSNFETVFSGHFHKRQNRNNIWYIGNCFPHNFADAGDDDRGMMILEWDKQPEFRTWPNQPTFRTYKLSELVSNPDRLLKSQSSIRVMLDIDISYEEANYIKETMIPQYQLREMALIPMKLDQHTVDLAPGNLKFESVDQIILNQISHIESEFYDAKLLLEIYKNL